ncbi:uncharacterized protein GBIM_20427 [Gryllus bimaculatus]|nr:uncharacterized protein GBIM_20427 [Gryllus bimaculatus]
MKPTGKKALAGGAAAGNARRAPAPLAPATRRTAAPARRQEGCGGQAAATRRVAKGERAGGGAGRRSPERGLAKAGQRGATMRDAANKGLLLARRASGPARRRRPQNLKRLVATAAAAGDDSHAQPLAGVMDPANGMTPLMYAVRDNRTSILDRMIDLGADVCARNNDNFNALHIAAMHSREDVVKLLLAKKGVDVYAAGGPRQQTAVHLVASRQTGTATSILRLLLASAGKDIRLQPDSKSPVTNYPRGIVNYVINHLDVHLCINLHVIKKHPFIGFPVLNTDTSFSTLLCVRKVETIAFLSSYIRSAVNKKMLSGKLNTITSFLLSMIEKFSSGRGRGRGAAGGERGRGAGEPRPVRCPPAAAGRSDGRRASPAVAAPAPAAHARPAPAADATARGPLPAPPW